LFFVVFRTPDLKFDELPNYVEGSSIESRPSYSEFQTVYKINVIMGPICNFIYCTIIV